MLESREEHAPFSRGYHVVAASNVDLGGFYQPVWRTGNMTTLLPFSGPGYPAVQGRIIHHLPVVVLSAHPVTLILTLHRVHILQLRMFDV